MAKNQTFNLKMSIRFNQTFCKDSQPNGQEVCERIYNITNHWRSANQTIMKSLLKDQLAWEIVTFTLKFTRKLKRPSTAKTILKYKNKSEGLILLYFMCMKATVIKTDTQINRIELKIQKHIFTFMVDWISTRVSRQLTGQRIVLNKCCYEN